MTEGIIWKIKKSSKIDKTIIVVTVVPHSSSIMSIGSPMNVTQVKLGSGDEWMYLGSDQEKEGQFVLIITSNHTTYSHMSQNICKNYIVQKFTAQKVKLPSFH